ncbi:SpoIIE family protein phosphatase [Streptomyces sp. NPDC004069]
MFLLQVVIAILIVAAAVIALLLQAEDDSAKDARGRSLGIAETLAYAPDTLKAMTGPNPTKLLQPVAQKIMKSADVDLVVVYSKDGIRYTHANPALIGKPVLGTRKPPKAPVTQTLQTTQGRSVVSYVPVTKPGGEAVGTVAVAITVQKVESTAGRQLPMLLGTAAGALLLSAAGTALVSRRLLRQTHGLGPAEMTRMYDHHDAVLHAVREGVLIVGGDERLLLANDEALRLLDLPPDAEGHKVTELPLDAGIAELLTSEHTASDEVHLTADRLLAVNKRPTAPYGGGYAGSVVTLRDTTELRALSGRAEVARERLKLLYDAGVKIGTTLDVSRTAQELADVAVPRFADIVTVELVEEVLRGQEPTGVISGVRRAAVRGGPGYESLLPVGRRIAFAPSTPQARCVESGRGVLEANLRDAPQWQEVDPDRARCLLERGIHSLIAVPLRARGTVLGVVDFWRCGREEPFDEEDVPFAEELAARAAVALDNARRYTREHTMAVTLQRSLLPRGLPEQSALEVAYRYLPARAGVGGDWFDVIELSGARVALVVGDVVGHGLHAAATMGRLRTAVHNFSTLDLAPDELLARLDDLVARLDRDGAPGGGEGLAGATCLYAVYDPCSGTCTLARAGHPPPALVDPDGTVTFPDVPAGPPLGLGGLPFEATELRLPEGSRLVLYTDGLVANRERDIGAGLELLRAALAHPDRTPEQTCRAVLDALPPDHASDDIALLVARTRVLDPDLVADWDVPREPAAVSRVRADVARQLKDWGLEDASYTTELVLSELVTNAIRYGSAPIHVRLLRDRKLICEVSDGSSTSPHLRYAATTDEGGRGLFLVARYAQRWGTRYTPTGKVIWTEQPLHGGAAPADGLAGEDLLDQWDDVAL